MRDEVTEIHKCEVCSSGRLKTVLDLGLHPMCDDLVPVDSKRECELYAIEILLCDRCFTAHQRYQVKKELLFPVTYHYRSRFTKDVVNGMVDFVNSCEERVGGLPGKMVLDVGCNDGSLLDIFATKGMKTIGIEPTDAYAEADKSKHLLFKAFLTPDLAAKIVSSYGQPDLITFSNVFAHIEDLSSLITALKTLLKVDSIVVIENHFLGSILQTNQFDTFYHEHPRTYSLTAFEYIARELGLSLLDVEFPRRYGGNIRIFMGDCHRKFETKIPSLLAVVNEEVGYCAKFENLQLNIECWKKKKLNLILSNVSKYGKLSAKAFPGRAAILIRLLGLNENHIEAVYEKPGSPKINHYVPGTRIPILSEELLFRNHESNRPLLNLAWHISDEIREYLKRNGFENEVIDIVSHEDFCR